MLPQRHFVPFVNVIPSQAPQGAAPLPSLPAHLQTAAPQGALLSWPQEESKAEACLLSKRTFQKPLSENKKSFAAFLRVLVIIFSRPFIYIIYLSINSQLLLRISTSRLAKQQCEIHLYQ